MTETDGTVTDGAMETPILVSEMRGRVLVLRLNRPERLNAVNRALLAEIRTALAEGLAAEVVHSIVLLGSERAFSAGADVKSGEPQEAKADWIRSVQGFFEELYAAAKPVVMGVRGYALGLGMGIAAAGDIVVGDDSTVMGLPEIEHGLVPGVALAPTLRRLSPAQVLELSLSGRKVQAEELLRLGLLDRQVANGAVDDAAIDAAEHLSRFDPSALAETKRLVRSLAGMEYRAALDFGRQRIEGFRAMRAMNDMAKDA